MARAAIIVGILLSISCKVEINDVNASFSIADAAWFAEEETLFIFYRVSAEQGIGDPSVVEVTYATDDERVDWTVVSDLPTVHTHLPVDCGEQTRCGSTSLHVPIAPRQVRVRLRYHRDGALALQPETVFNVVGPGPPHTNRSALIYGVFDEDNQRVQWRARHQFPTIRNHLAEELGLRRYFKVEHQRFGSPALYSDANPYAYGQVCPDEFEMTTLEAVDTEDRAVFSTEDLPLLASAHATVCATSTVRDATGDFVTAAVAHKNPEVRPAFPLLRSPVRDATPVKFFLEPCESTISNAHREMQRQRLQLRGHPVVCIDNWQDPDFVDGLVDTFRTAIDATRAAANDMVLVLGLHRDEAAIARLVEQAIAEVVPREWERSSPRVVGAFVLDSLTRRLDAAEVSEVTLWCPARFVGEEDSRNPDASERSCAIAPDNAEFNLGPFSFSVLPILPSRPGYLEFIDTYSESQAGEVTGLTFLAPEFTPTSDNVRLGEFGVATFLNGEAISAEGDDAFSFCTAADQPPVVFRSPLSQSIADEGGELPFEPGDGGDDENNEGEDDDGEDGEADEEPTNLEIPPGGVLPLEVLPEWHAAFGEEGYALAIAWDFPFLFRLDYELVVAGSVSAFSASVPFGFATSAESYYGTGFWERDEFSLERVLAQCTRFCDHPTFDSAGVYHVTDPFRTTYANTCYRPVYPRPSDSGYPLDP